MAAGDSHKMALHRVSFSLSIMLFVVAVVAVQPSATQTTCIRYSQKCGDYRDYFNAYDAQVDQEHKVLDSLEAQTSYINLADINNNDQVTVIIISINLIPISDSQT